VMTHGGSRALCAHGHIDRARFWLGTEAAERDAAHAVHLAEVDGDLSLRGRAKATLARALEENAKSEGAREAYREAIGLLSAAGDRLAEGEARIYYANFFIRAG